MANLAKTVVRNHNVHTPQLLPLPVKAGAVLFGHAIVATDANGLAVRGADTAGLTIQGVAYRPFDNTGDADGVLTSSVDQFDAARYVQVDQVGEWEFAVSGASPKPGQPAFVVDDNTVSAAATNNNLKLGRFTRPGNDGGWFVDIERR
jgi:hypothetical protein